MHQLTLLQIVVSPSPGTYNLKSTVGQRQPTIVGNALTTSFKNQASRSAFDKVYVPGGKSARGYEYIPGPGAYMLKHKQMGSDSTRCAIKYRIKNLFGKIFRY
jgi:hypothetical protein